MDYVISLDSSLFRTTISAHTSFLIASVSCSPFLRCRFRMFHSSGATHFLFSTPWARWPAGVDCMSNNTLCHSVRSVAFHLSVCRSFLHQSVISSVQSRHGLLFRALPSIRPALHQGMSNDLAGRSTAWLRPAYCFASVIVWTDKKKNVTTSGRFVCFIQTVKQSATALSFSRVFYLRRFSLYLLTYSSPSRRPGLRVTWPGLRIFWPENNHAPLLRWRRLWYLVHAHSQDCKFGASFSVWGRHISRPTILL